MRLHDLAFSGALSIVVFTAGIRKNMFLPLNQSTWMPLCGSRLLKDRHPEPLAAGCCLLLASHWSSRPILADFSPHWQRHGFAVLRTDSVLCASYRQVVQQSDAADASAWMVPVWLRPRSTPLRLCAPCNVQLRFHLPTGAPLLQGGPHKASVALLRLRRGSRNAPISLLVCLLRVKPDIENF